MTLDFDLPYDILSHKLLNYLINIPIYIYIYIVGVLGPRAHCLYIYWVWGPIRGREVV